MKPGYDDDYRDLYEQVGNGNRRKTALYEDDEDSMFDSIFEFENYCDNCGYEGPLDSRSKGYTCPECRTVIIPAD